MPTNYLQQAPGLTGPQVYVQAIAANGSIISGNLSVPALQDMTINNSNDVFTWTQLNEASKQQVATTATNSISTNLVVEEASFFGSTGSGTSATTLGLLGLSKNKTKVTVLITNFGSKTITANAFVTGLAPKISADQPVWITPITFTVTGDYTVA